MVDEIKLNNINTHHMPKTTDNKKMVVSNNTIKSDVDVTTHLSELVKSINSYIEPISNSALNEIKYQIQNNQYKIDYDRLSDRLLRSGMITMVGD